MKKGVIFRWGEECDYAFNMLKSFLTGAPVLVSPDFNKKFCLATDASDVAVAGVLLQESLPVAYFSKKLNSAQKNYSVIEKECLAIVLSVEHFEYYLSGCPEITVFCDHSPLSFLNSMNTKNQRITRWFLFLQKFNLKIQHIAGKDNVLADTLSRAV